ncbi:hypothetical protein ZHAS_00012266 [Anopheles sinensis]|uniref:Uncharacterized protein n=1 Tax=Anopheles sinensis TaxID=74873 RepID=A0A084W2N3_ANOSI|nr:hypothetical protein ZHAS_00012266 [Anopheles sinensis]
MRSRAHPEHSAQEFHDPSCGQEAENADTLAHVCVRVCFGAGGGDRQADEGKQQRRPTVAPGVPTPPTSKLFTFRCGILFFRKDFSN